MKHLLSIKDLSAAEIVEILSSAWVFSGASTAPRHPEMAIGHAQDLTAQDHAHRHSESVAAQDLAHRAPIVLDPSNLFAGKHVLIVGDILHSRVARSNLELITKLGGRVTFVAPPTLLPADLSNLPEVGVEYDFDVALAKQDFDAIMLLRIQAERMLGGKPGPTGSKDAGFFPSLEDYISRYSLTNERIATVDPNVPVLHPAPINRGLEISSEIADSKRSLINHQIRNGVFTRMACLDLLIGDTHHQRVGDNQSPTRHPENGIAIAQDLASTTRHPETTQSPNRHPETTQSGSGSPAGSGSNTSELLKGKTIVNLFFENSTRTRFSFEAAQKRLGAGIMNFSASGSSVSKGESLKDTVTTLYAMGIDGIVIRHQDSGAAYRLANSGWIDVPVLNAGDGTHAHPTQALLDAVTLWQHWSGFSQLHGSADMYGRPLN
jgi:aspartate carbamoyltransferase catalytic subunit